MRCRLCGGPTLVAAEREDLTLHRCTACAFVSGQPRQRPSTVDRYRHYYRGDPPPAPEYRYEEWLLEAERGIRRGRVLGIAGGRGCSRWAPAAERSSASPCAADGRSAPTRFPKPACRAFARRGPRSSTA